MTTVLALGNQKGMPYADVGMFLEFKNKFGISITEFDSLDAYVAVLLEKVSTKKLKLIAGLSGDAFDDLILSELKKREVYPWINC